jgi:hypothetical protein
MTEDRVKEILIGPLYKEHELNHELNNDEFGDFVYIINGKYFTLDLYCKKCNNIATFSNIPKNYDIKKFVKSSGIDVNNNFIADTIYNKKLILSSEFEKNLKLELICTRDNKTKILYFFALNDILVDKKVKGYILIKSGQYPSLADLENHNINKYSKILKDDLAIFKKGIGLNSHGIGAGAFIYLRIIFEHLIFSTVKENKIEFSPGTKIKDMIDKLKDFLPKFMYENKVIYSLLSSGLHNINEEYCINNFNLLKEVILLILDQKLKLIEEKQRENNLNKELNKIGSNLKNKS